MSRAAAVIFSIVFSIYRFIISEDGFYTAIGLGFSLYFASRLIDLIGKELPLKELLLTIAALQWIVGPKISYVLGKTHYKYYMYVDEYTYMSYVVPGFIALTAGLYAFETRMKLSTITQAFKHNWEYHKKISFNTLYVGLLSALVFKLFNLSSIGFFLYLGYIVLFVAVAHLLFVYPHRRIVIFSITIIYLFVESISIGLFHNFLLFSTFLMFFVFRLKDRFVSKLGLIVIAFLLMQTIQLVKSDLRKVTWYSEASNPLEVFYSLVKDQYFSPLDDYYAAQNQNVEEDEEASLSIRLNQGWIISKILENVPKNQPYLKGESISSGISAALLPRFLFPEKKGGEDALITFQKVTGIKLVKGTSMGLSIIGEFYANYGVIGGWIAMLLYGLFLSFSVKFIYVTIGNLGYGTITFWFILFFFQVVKAEANFIADFNHLIKSVIFYFVLKYGLGLWGINITSNLKKSYDREVQLSKGPV